MRLDTNFNNSGVAHSLFGANIQTTLDVPARVKTDKNTDSKSVFIDQAMKLESTAGGDTEPSIRQPKTARDLGQFQGQLQNIARDSGFSISNMVNSFQASLMQVTDAIVDVTHRARQGDTALANKLQEIGVKSAHQAADHMREAGKAAANQSVVSGAISIAGAATGLVKAGQSYKQGKLGISQQHNSLNFQKQAKELNSNLHRTPVRGNDYQHGMHSEDRTLISSGAVLPMEHESGMSSIQAAAHQNKAVKANAQAMASTQMGNMGGQITSSPFQVEQSEHNAAATLETNNKDVVMDTYSKVTEKKRNTRELMQMSINEIANIVKNISDTMSTISSRV